MATIKPAVVPAKALKGGRHKVRISISHNGEFRYILTDIVIDSAKEFKNGQIVKRPDAAMLNTKLRGLLQKYQSAIDELEYIDGLTCPELVYQLLKAGNNKRRTLSSIYKEYIEYGNMKDSSRATYAVVYKSITSFINENTLVENIRHSTVLGLDKALRDRKLKPTSIRFHVTFLITLVNYAKKCGYVQYKVSPFLGYKLPNAEVRQAWLTVEEVRRIRDFETPRKSLARCRDLFMLSYYLGGINMADLKDIDFNEQTETIHYARRKTELRQKLNKYVEFDIPKEALEIVRRHKGKDGRIMLTEQERKSSCRNLFTHYMPRLAKEIGIRYLVYYSARKSFSQHAFMLGVGTSTIDYILGHRVDKDGTSLYNYITVTPELATKAVRLVLDNLKNG